MFSKPDKKEINRQTIKLIIGLIAIFLASFTSYFSDSSIQSISASYHSGGMSRDIFVGFLFAISAFLFAYNGLSLTEMLLSKVAAFAALGVALFPCKCGCFKEIIPNIHATAAFIMFSILAGFCLIFYRRSMSKGHSQALIRAKVYAICGSIIVIAILIVAIDGILGNKISLNINRLVFYCEAAALGAFGVAWLVASRILPIITSEEERCSLSPFKGENIDESQI